MLAGMFCAGVSAGLIAVRIEHRVRPMIQPGPCSPQQPLYEAEVLQQSRRTQQFNDVIVFLGDSQTVGFATSNLAGRTENFGISGDTLEGLLTRVPRYQLAGAKAVVVEIGTNNLVQHQTAGFEEKYNRLLEMLPPKLTITALAVTPLTQAASTEFKITTESIKTLNDEIKSSCGQHINCHYLDLWHLLALSDGSINSQYAEGDGLHLSTAGYRIWAREITSER